MKQKEVEDVFGGKEEFANADSVASKSQAWRGTFPYGCWNKLGGLGLMLCFLFPFSLPAAQCPAEDCNGDRAYFFQLQIRSADEPMTTFLKVGAHQRLMRFSCIWPDMPC